MVNLMLLAITYYIRLLVHQVILRPELINSRDINIQKQNFMIIASVIYHLVLDLFKDLKIRAENQDHLAAYEKVLPGYPLLASKI